MASQQAATAGDSVNNTRMKRLYLIAIGVAFLVGLIPMWLLAHSRAVELDAAYKKIAAYQLSDMISMSAMYARKGEYENARKNASTFFTQLRSTFDSGDNLSSEEREALRPVLEQRDQIITLLARSDPAAVDRLFGIEYQLRQALKAHR